MHKTAADPIGVLEGAHFLDGDHAITEGALAAGCRFFAGYPITPSTESAERFAERAPHVGGMFVQMEDELASVGALIGAANKHAGPTAHGLKPFENLDIAGCVVARGSTRRVEKIWHSGLAGPFRRLR